MVSDIFEEDVYGALKSWADVREYLKTSSAVVVRIPENELSAEETLELSPFDMVNLGRAVSMVWHYDVALDCGQLVSSLRKMLVHYPVLSGRYSSSSPTVIDLNNKGVPVEICTVDGNIREAVSHLTPSRESGPSSFDAGRVDTFLPSNKNMMDPDKRSPEAPLFAVKISLFEKGTTIGVLLQHGVCDAEADISFMSNWSCVFRGLSMDNPPVHNRMGACGSQDQPVEDCQGIRERIKLVPNGEIAMPEFAPVMPKIMGRSVCLVPFSKSVLSTFKRECQAALPERTFVSTDDVLTAKVWKALCKSRCKQLSISLDSSEPTTCMRACNVRRRVHPRLAPGYCGNCVINIYTVMTVQELLSMSVTEVALRLRTNIQKECTPGRILALSTWMKVHQDTGLQTKITFDAKALTFIISSWIFPGAGWEGVDFNAIPICFDHGCLVPVVANFTPRPGGDGINVWTSGTKEAMECYADSL